MSPCEAARRSEIDHRKWAVMTQDERAATFRRLLRVKDRNTHIAKSSGARRLLPPRFVNAG